MSEQKMECDPHQEPSTVGGDGVKWTFLEHNGPVFAPDYERLPKHVKFYYDGKEVELSEKAEEVAGFYAKWLDRDHTCNDVFNKNFFEDWREVMTDDERAIITDLKKCNFKKMHAYFMDVAKKNKNRSKEEKKTLKEKNEATVEKYGTCNIDGLKQNIQFKLPPPGLFIGLGEHPKNGKVKERLKPEDIRINCSKDSKIPKPPLGHKWNKVCHLNTFTWLFSYRENIQQKLRYRRLHDSSKLKGEGDLKKYEAARRLHKCIKDIRKQYQEDWKSKKMKVRQRAVALYFIDKLALRAGNEKDEDQADTVGCCSLKVKHIKLHEQKDDKKFVVVFNFLGKASMRYYNEVPVEKRVFKNLGRFMENKKPGDDLFDRLNTQIMNKHLNELMEGLTIKVFRTYNASFTLQEQLDELTKENDTEANKILAYKQANTKVAILCNHRLSLPKGHEKSMGKSKKKVDQNQNNAERQDLSLDTESLTDTKISLVASKLYYLDPRITVAWCKKYNVPIEKIYNKTQREKFAWAINSTGPDYRFELIDNLKSLGRQIE
ncbi:DNA topoisomerase 1-like [Diabrotica undecimpunctata]|uniref:DNA topoisomerase 1-like n=1 Tax=Diabrotica undecimpunctata TaxID=50387 RepID=UPI003B63E15E